MAGIECFGGGRSGGFILANVGIALVVIFVILASWKPKIFLKKWVLIPAIIFLGLLLLVFEYCLK